MESAVERVLPSIYLGTVFLCFTFEKMMARILRMGKGAYAYHGVGWWFEGEKCGEKEEAWLWGWG